MKAYIYILTAILFATFSASCGDEAVDKKNSIYDEDFNVQRSKFDKWILNNLTLPYNLDLKYRFEDKETDPIYNLAPASEENSQILAQIVKFAWFEAYDEAVGIRFMRLYGPKMLMFIGSPAYDNSSSEVIASAEGGLKVILYRVNSLELTPEYMNYYYFHAMHHEFCHILNQTKNYTPLFEKITDGSYLGGDWYTKTAKEAHTLGFVSQYARSEPNEDFAEVYSIYITSSEKEWNNIIISAGVEGAKLINEKLDIVREYTLNSWSFSLDDLRLNLARRAKEIHEMEFEQFNEDEE